MTKEIKTERRWLRSVIAASAEPLPDFAWMRAARRRPAAMAPDAVAPAAPPRSPFAPSPFARSRPVAAR